MGNIFNNVLITMYSIRGSRLFGVMTVSYEKSDHYVLLYT